MLLQKQICLTTKNSSVTTTVFFRQKGVVDDQKILAFSSQSISDLFKSGLKVFRPKNRCRRCLSDTTLWNT